ncbi:hypothetical protein MMC25_005004 [Agyrium rufum]|nr:hypothetical protein [Agyrium rufum]
MVSFIYQRTLSLRTEDLDASAAVSLMSSDVDQISYCFDELNELWSRSIEALIGIVLLTLATYGCSFVTKAVGPALKAWKDATQRRIGVTSSMLNEMKSLKMMGLTEVMTEALQAERVTETQQMERFGVINTWQNVIGNAPVITAPAATFAAYAVQAYAQGSSSLDATKAFTTLALIALVSYPVSRVLSAVPNTASSLGCFERIQSFLLSESREDNRKDIALVELNDDLIELPSSGMENVMLRIVNADIKVTSQAQPLLRSVNLTIPYQSVVMATGKVGAGKTTLLKTILGEIPINRGSVYVETRKIAYCAQSSWLPNGSIRKVVCGPDPEASFDEKWYQTVLRACVLDEEIADFSDGDQRVIGSRGGSLSGGQKHRLALARALYSRAQLFVLDDILSALDQKTEAIVLKHLFGENGLFKKLGSTVIMATHSSKHLSYADQILVLSSDDGSVKQLAASDEDAKKVLKSAVVTDAAADRRNDKASKDDNKEQQVAKVEGVEAIDMSRQTGDLTVYRYYFRSVGAWPLFLFFAFLFIHVFSQAFSQIWLKWWTDINGGQIPLYISVYFLLAVVYLVGDGGYSWAISCNIGPATGRKLHRLLLEIVMRAPLGLFTRTDTGSILNRFSQDMSLIESQLAIGILIVVSNLFYTIAEAALIAVGSSYMFITIPFFMLTIYFVQNIYLKTSRQLRFLDLETRSPVYSHFTETLEGLATIRAFGWEREFMTINAQRLDDSQKPYYLMFCIQRWLAVVLDLIIAAMATIVIALATTLRYSTSPGLLGVSLNNVLGFNLSLSSFVTAWTMLETSIGAIVRLRDFENTTEIEAKAGEDVAPSEGWPSKGLIEIESLTAAYDSTTTALQQISVKILPGQKVGICGRTGSGKSSLLSAILRLIEISSGSISIDSVDLASIPRTIIRSRLNALPQDALQLSGTVRFNVDPFGRNSDADIVTALNKVSLWSILAERGGLAADLQLNSLSKGQQQLLALARALLHKSKVLLLDEATSSVDEDTDRTMQGVIRAEFRDCTVITVAHRLDTIMDSDLIIMMEGGKVVEIGNPTELMEKEDSDLKKLSQR